MRFLGTEKQLDGMLFSSSSRGLRIRQPRLARVDPSSDRAREARRWASILDLVPDPGRDARAARRGLLELTAAGVDGDHAAHTRTWLAWINATEGRGDTAKADPPKGTVEVLGEIGEIFQHGGTPEEF